MYRSKMSKMESASSKKNKIVLDHDFPLKYATNLLSSHSNPDSRVSCGLLKLFIDNSGQIPHRSPKQLIFSIVIIFVVLCSSCLGLLTNGSESTGRHLCFMLLLSTL